MQLTSDRLLELSEGADLEVKACLGHDGRGELSRSFWDTYSAMANTDGGVVLLGIREKKRGDFEVVGLTDVAKVRKALWDGANNREQVSINLLLDSSVEVLDHDSKKIIRVSIPRAKRGQRPVYVGRNPLTGTYQRNYEGDYRCDSETVKRMLAEQVEEERDGKLLPAFGIEDLDPASVRDYRNAVRAAKPNLLWHDLDDAEFLKALGAFRRDRETGCEGLTLGGLLMLGKLPAIQEAVPNYMLDYQERPAPKVELRWIDRLTTDGEWSGNLFDFCRLTLRKLYKDLPISFQLSGATRVDETPVHVALREALVNTLIHADFSGSVSILIVKRPDLFGFRNPGCMRVALADAMAGGISDCRNRVLQRLFRMAGYAEQAGYGIPTIYTGWRKQVWRAPYFVERRDRSEQTILTMPLISLLSDDVVSALEVRFGSRYKRLPMTQQMALATVVSEGKVTHGRLKAMVWDHPKDISAALSTLCRDGFLESAGAKRGTFYFFPGEPPLRIESEPLLFDNEATGRKDPCSEQPASEQIDPASEQMGAASEQIDPTSEQMRAASEQIDPASEQIARDSERWHSLLEAAREVRESKKAASDKMDSTILELCSRSFLTLRELEELTGRGADTLRVHYLSRLAREGKIRLRFPEAIRHPNQAYTSSRLS
ncbi:MAG TPA: RNA-binding domain-containing protein [Thermoanaerobaculia bacterium]|nr:RNA-binding domain-containing protein [Thermoanaerobaculia bacterium]